MQPDITGGPSIYHSEQLSATELAINLNDPLGTTLKSEYNNFLLFDSLVFAAGTSCAFVSLPLFIPCKSREK